MPERRDQGLGFPPKGDAPKQVGLWIRVSTEDQVRGESPEHHEARGRMYAEMKGWTIVRVYRLDAISGKSVMGRPETVDMLKDLREGKISGLIFSKLARLARNTKELLEFADIFRKEGADLISLAESIDTSSPAGRFFYTLIAALAEWEREEVSARVSASVSVRAKLGKPVAGIPPFGYRWDGKTRLLPDSAEAPVVKLMFELFRTHRRISQVVRLLNQAGHRTRKGGIFTESTIHNLLKNPVAKGRHLTNYSRQEGKKRLLKPETEWVWTEVEPIVSEELWDECHVHLADNAAKAKRRGRPAVQLFSGVLFCSCGGKMYVPSNTPKYVCKGCRNKIPIIDLDQVFHEKLRDFFLDPEQVAGYLGQGNEILDEKEGLLQTLTRERSRLSLELDKLYRLDQELELSGKSFGERHRPLEERARQMDGEIPRLQGETDFLRVQQLTAADFAAEAGSLYTRWPELAFEERRQIVEHAVQRITVGKDEIEISLFYEPPARALLPPPSLSLGNGGKKPPHSDHCGGLVDIAAYLPVREVWMAPGWDPAGCAGSLLALPGVRTRFLWRGKGMTFGRWRLRALHPEADDHHPVNERSLVLLAVVRGRRALLTGDVESWAERDIARCCAGELKADLLKVAHHGSRTSSTPAFLDAVAPRLALISVGLDNRYHHPSPEVVARLAERCRLLRTDRAGEIAIWFETGGRMRLELPGEPK